MKQGLRLLLVDDESIVHMTLGDYLSDCGHTVEKALDGSEALLAIQSRRFDLIIADVRMPGLNGLSLLERVRQLESDPPVILITGHGDVEMEREANRIGAAGFLLKPIRLAKLDELIETAMTGGAGTCT